MKWQNISLPIVSTETRENWIKNKNFMSKNNFEKGFCMGRGEIYGSFGTVPDLFVLRSFVTFQDQDSYW